MRRLLLCSAAYALAGGAYLTLSGAVYGLAIHQGECSVREALRDVLGGPVRFAWEVVR